MYLYTLKITDKRPSHEDANCYSESKCTSGIIVADDVPRKVSKVLDRKSRDTYYLLVKELSKKLPTFFVGKT